MQRAVMVALFPVASLMAQGLVWRNIPAAVAPPARCGHAMFFDLLAGNVVLFGGSDAASLADTWTWDATNGWIQRQPAHSPPAGPVYTSFVRSNGDCIVFSQRNTLWRWTGTDWIQLQTIGQPPPLISTTNPDWVASAWDGNRDVLVHVMQTGGLAVWELPHSSIWTRRTWTTPTPSLGSFAAAACLPGRGVMFHGGIDSTTQPPTYPVSTWLWNTAGWTQLAATGPFGYHRHLMAYHPARQRMVMATTTHALLEWQDVRSSWLQMGTGSTAFDHVWVPMVYDPMQERMLAFGTGFFQAPDQQFDALDSVTPARLEVLGVGCAGTAGIPELGTGGTRPWIGDTLLLDIGPVQRGNALLWVFSLDRSAWGGLPLPVDLGQFGMPGCSLQVNPATVDFTWASLAGRGDRFLFFDSPALAGWPWYLQTLVLDRSANALGGVVSNGLALRFGLR